MAPNATISPQDVRRVSSARWLMPILALMSAGERIALRRPVRGAWACRGACSAVISTCSKGSAGSSRNPGTATRCGPNICSRRRDVSIAAWCEGVMAQRARLGIAPARPRPLVAADHGRASRRLAALFRTRARADADHARAPCRWRWRRCEKVELVARGIDEPPCPLRPDRARPRPCNSTPTSALTILVNARSSPLP